MGKEIINIIKELSGFERIENASLLVDDLGLDSLAMVMLLINVEDTFDIQLKESDMNPFELKSVNDVINLVYKYLGGES